MSRRTEQAHMDRIRAARDGMDNICLLCGRSEPCMTDEEGLAEGGPGSPCTFEFPISRPEPTEAEVEVVARDFPPIELHDALERLHEFCNGNAKRAYSTTDFLEVMEQIGDEWSRATIAAMSRREGGLAIKGHGGHGNGREPPDVPAGYVDGVEPPQDPEALVKALERIKGLPSPYGARCIAAQALKDWRG